MTASYPSAIILVSLLLVAPATRTGEPHTRDDDRPPHVPTSIVETTDLHGRIAEAHFDPGKPRLTTPRTRGWAMPHPVRCR